MDYWRPPRAPSCGARLLMSPPPSPTFLPPPPSTSPLRTPSPPFYSPDLIFTSLFFLAQPAAVSRLLSPFFALLLTQSTSDPSASLLSSLPIPPPLLGTRLLVSPLSALAPYSLHLVFLPFDRSPRASSPPLCLPGPSPLHLCLQPFNPAPLFGLVC